MIFNKGDTVEHKDYGIGTIEFILDEDDDDEHYVVKFKYKRGYTTVTHKNLKSRPELKRK